MTSIMIAHSRSIVWLDDNGRVHREGGLPAIVDRNGDREWFEHGKYVRCEFDDSDDQCRMHRDNERATNNGFVLMWLPTAQDVSWARKVKP
jgi:hypothetical protein